jgi:N-carbamoyl-L-amino-acid hydrolase
MDGSHLQIATGGWFDCRLRRHGRVRGDRSLNDLGYETQAPVEVVAWVGEAGSHFSPAVCRS